MIATLVASLPGVKYGALYYCFLEKCKLDALRRSRGDFDSSMILSCAARTEIQRWFPNTLSSVKPINVPPPSVTIQTDASSLGWGCVFNGEITGGPWSPEESVSHINILELNAVLFGFIVFLSELSWCSYHSSI